MANVTITQAQNLLTTLRATATPTNAPDAAALARVISELAAAVTTYNGVATGVPGALPNFVGGTQFYPAWLIAYTAAFAQADAAARQALAAFGAGTFSALAFDTTAATLNLLTTRLTTALAFVPIASGAEITSLTTYKANVVALFTAAPSASDPVLLAGQATAQAMINAAYLDAGGWATAQGISYS